MTTPQLFLIISELPDFKKLKHAKVMKHRFVHNKNISLDKMEKIFNEFGYEIDWIKKPSDPV